MGFRKSKSNEKVKNVMNVVLHDKKTVKMFSEIFYMCVIPNKVKTILKNNFMVQHTFVVIHKPVCPNSEESSLSSQ